MVIVVTGVVTDPNPKVNPDDVTVGIVDIVVAAVVVIADVVVVVIAGVVLVVVSVGVVVVVKATVVVANEAVVVTIAVVEGKGAEDVTEMLGTLDDVESEVVVNGKLVEVEIGGTDNDVFD